MTLLTSMFGGAKLIAGDRDPFDDRWYGPTMMRSATGLTLRTEDILKASAALACVRVISETISTLPLLMYERVGSDDRKRANDHPLFDLLRHQPNKDMTAVDFWGLCGVFLLLWGTFYAEIIPGRRGFADQLIPLHTDRVRMQRMENGRLRYLITEQSEPGITGVMPAVRQRVILEDQMFRVIGLSLNGKLGLRVMDLAREVVALALAGEGYAARLFSNDARPGGVLEAPGKVDDTARDELKESWYAAHAGVPNAHKVAVLTGGMKFHEIAHTARDSQMVDARKHQAIEVARIFRVQPHKIGILDRATFSNIEQQALEFVVDTMTPWLTRIQASIRRDLIIAPNKFFAEFMINARMWADSEGRAKFFTQMWNIGVLSQNEIRRMENLNSIPGGDTYFVPLNMVPVGQTALVDRTRALARGAAARVARKEMEQISANAAKLANDPASWREWVLSFYAKHAQFVADALQLDPVTAQEYTDRRRDGLLAMGMENMAIWQSTLVPALVALAMGDREHGQARNLESDMQPAMAVEAGSVGADAS